MKRFEFSMLMLLSPLLGMLGCTGDPLLGDKAAVVGEKEQVPDEIAGEVGDEESSTLAGLVSEEEPAGEPLAKIAATPIISKTASARLAYNLKGLRHNRAIQKAYIAKSYVYVTQRVNGTCYLSRLRIQGNEARFVDQMTVTNTGHCQTLDMYTYKNKDWFYFSSKSDNEPVEYWSLQVARLEYRAGATVNYTSLRRFTYMNYANPQGSRLGTTLRVDGGGNSTHTFFRVQTTEGSVTWSIYDTQSLNSLLDANMEVRLDGDAAKRACISSFTQRGSAIIRPNGSFQGGDLLGSTKLFTSGGGEGDTSKVALISSSGVYQTLVTITNVGKREIEGLQTKNGNVYFTIVTNQDSKQDTQKIYFVPDNIF